MKSFSLGTLLMVLMCTTTAQSSFQISGQIAGMDSGAASLNYVAGRQARQIRSEIKNGKFVFNGTLPEPEYLNITIKTESGNREVGFFAGNENVYILIDTAHWDSPSVTGSLVEKEYESYRQLTKSVDERSGVLNKTGSALYLSGKLDDKSRDSLFRIHDQLDQEKRTLIAEFAKANPSSAVSAWAISIFYGYEPNLVELRPAYQSLSRQNQQGIYGKQIAEIIRAAEKTAIGSVAPDFTVNDLSGKPVSLHAYRGKFVLVDFWASWCGPCRAENPNVVRVYKKHHSDQFDILGVSLDINRELWLKAVKKDSLPWTQGSDLKAWE